MTRPLKKDMKTCTALGEGRTSVAGYPGQSSPPPRCGRPKARDRGMWSCAAIGFLKTMRMEAPHVSEDRRQADPPGSRGYSIPLDSDH